MVVLAQHVAKKIFVTTSLMLGLDFLFPGISLAQTSAEMATAQFSGTKINAQLTSVRATTAGDFFAEPGAGYLTSITLNGAVNATELPDTYGIVSISQERRGSISLSQSVGKLTNIGVSSGYIKGAGFSRFDSLSFGQWWNKATILTDLSATMSRSERLSRDYQDTDGLRVRVAPRTDGRTWRLGLTWLARPDFMIIGSAATTTSSDRPRANAETLEARYFINATATAIHLGADAYDDTAQVVKTTDYGRIVARTANMSIHQHLNDQWIASVAIRDHRETETPRSSDSASLTRHARELRGKIRWRQVTGPVTDDVSEVFVFAGQYVSYDQSTMVQHMGLGGKYVL